MTVVEVVQNPATWIIYFGVIAIFVLISLFRNQFGRDTWVNFFQFMVGVGALLFGVGWGFQWLPAVVGLDFSDSMQYSVSSVITVVFMVLYGFMLYKLFQKLSEKEGFRWIGIVATTFVIGCIMNAIATGGRYLPVIGWFL